MSLHDELRALKPTWYAGMYGCREDMFTRSQLDAILARHPEAAPVNICDPCACVGPLSPGLHVRPQLQVQAPVGEGLENGASGEERRWMIATLDAVDVEHDFDSGDIPSTTTYVDALLAAGYRKPTLPSVDDVAKVLAHTDGGHHEALFDAGHESTIALYMRHATAILDLFNPKEES